MATLDQALLQELQYQLLEPPDGGQRWPSGLWTRDEVLAIASQRQADLLGTTFLLVAIGTLIPVVAGTFRVDLPDDLVILVTVVWRGADGTVRELVRADSFETDHALPTWETVQAAAPLVYMDQETPQGFVQIAPAPSGAGNLDLLYVPVAAALTGNGVPLLVPDELGTPVLKYGVLADLLNKDGRGQDLGRAAYCAQRYQLGLEAAEIILKGWS